MIPVQDLFEAHLTVTDLDRAIEFYRDAVGLRLAHVTPARQAAFFWIGPAGNAMLGLWAAGSGPQRMALHTAFRVSLADVVAAPRALRSARITPLDDYPLHQTPLPIAQMATGDPNHYDRYWFNGYSVDGDWFFGIAMGLYPNRGIIDAAFSFVADGTQHAVYASGRAPVCGIASALA